MDQLINGLLTGARFCHAGDAACCIARKRPSSYALGLHPFRILNSKRSFRCAAVLAPSSKWLPSHVVAPSAAGRSTTSGFAAASAIALWVAQRSNDARFPPVCERLDVPNLLETLAPLQFLRHRTPRVGSAQLRSCSCATHCQHLRYTLRETPLVGGSDWRCFFATGVVFNPPPSHPRHLL